jgi:hypothetical protein
MFSATAFNGLRNPFASDYQVRLQEMAAIVAELATLQPEIASLLKEKKRVRENLWFPALIGPTPTPNYSRVAWTYQFTEVNIGLLTGSGATASPAGNADFTNPSGLRTGDAINVAESANTDVLAYGYAVTAGGPPWYLSAVGFTACEFMPVPYPTIVFMREVISGVGVRYEFWAPNPINPACEEV